MKPMNDFWTATSKYGVIHRLTASDAPATLVVFVHGLFGDCRRTWGRMPEWVLQAADADLDVVSFGYPTKLWERSSIPLAVDDLRTWLETEFCDHRHLLFVTHSMGGLVVKQLLRQAYREIEPQIGGASLDFSSSSLWLRTRRVINIAVPHSGGSPLITYTSKSAYQLLLYPLMAPFLALSRFLTQGRKDWGRNDVVTALRWRNPWLLDLEKEFVGQLRDSCEQDIPYPGIHDIYAKADLSVPIDAEINQRDIYFRGTHKTVKIAGQPGDPVVAIVGRFVASYTDTAALALSDKTLSRIAEVNKITTVDSLIAQEPDAGEQPPDAPTPTVSTTSFGTQTAIRDAVIEAIHAGSEQPRQLVVTGVAGVGKSVVLRMIAWRLAADCLAEPKSDAPLPLLIPLQQITFDGAVDQEIKLGGLLKCWWLEWIPGFCPELAGNASWLEERLQTMPTAVILDGLDDFLINHPSIGLSSVIAMLRQAVGRYATNPRLSFVVAIRAGFPGLERLAGDPRDIHEILRLSAPQAKRCFPACRKWLDSIDDRQLVDLILTPLILSNYEPGRDDRLDSEALTQTSILDQTIRTILRRSSLIGMQSGTGLPVEIDHLVDALTLIAWLFFYRSRGEIRIAALQKEARDVNGHWRRFMRDSDLTHDAEELAEGFRLVEQEGPCSALLQRSVFVSTGSGKVRFSHRHWQEFLLARYFALCLRSGHVEDFGATAFNSHIYRMAGEIQRGYTITEEQMQSVLKEWRNSGNTYVTGNVLAFLAWTQTAIEARAINLLLDQLAHFEALSRVILIAGLGYRVLVAHEEDLSAVDLRRALFPRLREFSDTATAPVDDPVASSLAWCYQKALAEKFDMPQPQCPWPAIGFDDAETAKALPMICTIEAGELILDTRSRSLQLAFLVPILDAYSDSNLAIRALHYLYYLVVARKHGIHVMELTQELPPLLASGCEFEKVIDSFTLVPEVRELYKRCQTMHRSLDSALL
jgi:pimeloyl-ACP methyl ester carboxylesterase